MKFKLFICHMHNNYNEAVIGNEHMAPVLADLHWLTLVELTVLYCFQNSTNDEVISKIYEPSYVPGGCSSTGCS